MAQWLRRWLRRLVVLLVLLAAAAAGCGFLLNKYLAPEFLLAQTQQLLGPSFPGKLQLQRVALEFPDRVRLEGTLCAMPPVFDKPLFQAATLTAQVDLGALLEGRYALKAVSVQGFKVHLQRALDGTTNVPGVMLRASLPPELPRALLATAGVLPKGPFTVESLELHAGQLTFDDALTAQSGQLDKLEGQLSYENSQVRVDSLTGVALGRVPFKVSGQFAGPAPHAGELLVELTGVDLAMVQERVPRLNGIRALGIKFEGGLDTQTQLKGDAARVDSSSRLSFRNLAIQDPMFSRSHLWLPAMSGKLGLRNQPGQGVTAELDLASDSLTIKSLSDEPLAVVSSAVVGLDLAWPRLGIRSVRGRLGGGLFDVKGSVDGLMPRLEVQASSLNLGPLLGRMGLAGPRPWLGQLTVDSFNGKFAIEEFSCSPGVFRIARDSVVTVNGALRPGRDGYEPAGVSGNAEVLAPIFAQVTGVANPALLGGRMSVRFTAETTSFTAEVRTQDLVLAGVPELRFRALAAAIRGLMLRNGPVPVNPWSANMRAGEFTLFWPQLLKGMGLPLEGPVSMTSGEALATSDLQGLHFWNLRLVSPKIVLSGRLDISPSRALSGELTGQAFAAPGMPLPPVIATVSGTLDAPVVVPR
jgi:hypothetical protein